MREEEKGRVQNKKAGPGQGSHERITIPGQKNEDTSLRPLNQCCLRLRITVTKKMPERVGTHGIERRRGLTA
jgi:hypothetical protein